MKFNIGEIVTIAPPEEAASFVKDYVKGNLLGTVVDYCNDSNSYEVKLQNGIRDWYFETWLKKAEEDTNIPHQPTVPPMPKTKKEMDWSKIKELTWMAITNKKDIVITINADGSKEIEITTPTTSIVETNMRTRYVPEGEMKND